MSNLAVTCLVADPTNPDIIYAGTGEGFGNGDALLGAGIFRTLDGVDWSQLAATTGAQFQAINRLALSGDGAVVLAATPFGIYSSADAGRLAWVNTLEGAIADVKFHPNDVSAAIAGGLSNGQAYYSADGGSTWTAAQHPGAWSGRVELTYAKRDPSIVYASVQMQAGEIWRSADGGRTYARCGSLNGEGQPANYLGDQGWYGNAIWAGDPSTSDMVIVGGIDLWKSTDGGDTLRDISTWWAAPQSAHADHHCIAARPDYDGVGQKTVFFGNDGGIYKTNDLAAVGMDAGPPRVSGWIKLDNTYGITQFYFGAGNAASGTIVGGAQDNGTIRFTPAAGQQGGPNRWTQMFGGDGGWCAADSTDPNYFYGEYVYLNIVRSSDGGASSDYISGQYWNGADWTWKPVPYRITDASNQNALFIAPFVLDPNQPNRILGGGASLWRTDGARTPNTNATGPSWTTIKPDVGSQISAIAVAAGDADLIWVGHANGQIYQTANGTAASPGWQRVDQTGAQPLSINRYCSRIVIDPATHTTTYVLFAGYAADNAWRTDDGGATWSNIGATLPQAPVRSLAIHPTRPGFLYLGSEVGLFASEDGGANWSPTNEGPTNCSVDDLFWMNTSLICVTHGRGIFRMDLA